VDRVGSSRVVGFQTTRSFDLCLHFHAGRLSGEKAGLPEGSRAPKGALIETGHDDGNARLQQWEARQRGSEGPATGGEGAVVGMRRRISTGGWGIGEGHC
jgi:hypothetical protein